MPKEVGAINGGMMKGITKDQLKDFFDVNITGAWDVTFDDLVKRLKVTDDDIPD